MKRHILFALPAAAMIFALCSCGEPKTLHCDHYGQEVNVGADSNMEEDWIIYCGDCNEELFGDAPIVKPGS